jgi:hypothetical protein
MEDDIKTDLTEQDVRVWESSPGSDSEGPGASPC